MQNVILINKFRKGLKGSRLMLTNYEINYIVKVIRSLKIEEFYWKELLEKLLQSQTKY